MKMKLQMHCAKHWMRVLQLKFYVKNFDMLDNFNYEICHETTNITVLLTFLLEYTVVKVL